MTERNAVLTRPLADVDVPFGAHVEVSAVVRPVYVEVHFERIVQDVTPGAWKTIKENDGPLQYRPVGHHNHRYAPDECDENGIPGEPIDDAPLPEKKGIYRFLRRFPRDVEGVVVGKTWRAEGQYHEGYSYAGYGGIEPDWQPSYLSEHRRVTVVQIAVDPGEVGGAAWSADVVLALPDGLTRMPVLRNDGGEA